MSTGIILGNLGTPRSPSKKDVGLYLKEFLMDPYVIDKPAWFRWLLVNCVIVPFRSSRSAKAYSKVWSKEGSPLLAESEKLKTSMQSHLGADYIVSLGMSYGQPSIEQAFKEVADCETILVAPQYPQYAESSYKTWVENAKLIAKRMGLEERLKIMCPFYGQPEYVGAQTQVVADFLSDKDYDHLLLSYHGLPVHHVQKLDPSGEHCMKSKNCCEEIVESNALCYRAQCYSFSREMTVSLGLSKEQYSVSFQSRLGREPWIEPFTDIHIKELAEKGIKRIAVAMPAFTADCLETLEEVGIELRKEFLSLGGEEFHMVPCMNDNKHWVEALSQLIKKELLRH